MTKRFSIWFLAFTLLIACEVESDPEYVFPKEYLPAYPGSYWDYTNGERVIVEQNYALHKYQPDINSPQRTAEKYVPVINGQYLYEYSITQNSMLYPLKKLLDEQSTKEWIVNEVNGVAIKRQVVKNVDSLYINFPPFTDESDSLFTDVLVVVEFIDSLKADRWNVKEYYAKGVGLIRREIDNPFDNDTLIVEKEIQNYFIDK